MKNNILSSYKKLTDYDKNNLDNYLIFKGIFTVSPSLSEEEALFLFDMCKKVENENINLFSVAHYITDNYISGNITKNNLIEANSSSICSSVYFDKLEYFYSENDKYSLEQNKIDAEKKSIFNDLCGDWDFRNIDMTVAHLGGINYNDNKFYFIIEKFSPILDDYVMCEYEFNDKELIENFENLDIHNREEVRSFMSSCEMKIDWKKATEELEKLEDKEIEQEELEIEI